MCYTRRPSMQGVTMTESRGPAPVSSGAPSSAPGKLIVALVFAAALVGFFYFDLGRYLSLDGLKENRDRLLSFADSHYGAAVGLFIVAYIVQTAFSLPGGAIMTLAGGFLFGAFAGTLYVNVGATTGATLAFLASRSLLRDSVEKKFGHR